MKIAYGNTDITSLTLEYKRKGSIDDKNVFLLGNTPSYQIDIKLDNESQILQTLSGNICEYDKEGKLIGTYLVYEAPERYTDVVSLTCFDNMLLTNIPYDSKLTYPVTIKDQLDEISRLTGLAIDYSDLPALNQEVNWWDNTISCRDYIGWIAEISGKNAYAAADGMIRFKSLSMSTDWETSDVEDYEKEDLFSISRICFDNGLLKLEAGEPVNNTLYLSTNNPYIDTQNDPVQRIYDMYKGLSIMSVDKLKIGGLDDLRLFDIIKYKDMHFICLDVTSTYKGGEYQIQDIRGKLDSQNSEKVTIRYDDMARIKKLAVLIDQNKQSLEIVAKEQSGLNEKVSKITLDMESIKLHVSETETKIETIEHKKMYRIEIISSNGIIFKNTNIQTVLSARVWSWDEDVTDTLPDILFKWTRVSDDKENDEYWNNEYGKNKKKITVTNEDVDQRATFFCDLNITQEE